MMFCWQIVRRAAESAARNDSRWDSPCAQRRAQSLSLAPFQVDQPVCLRDQRQNSAIRWRSSVIATGRRRGRLPRQELEEKIRERADSGPYPALPRIGKCYSRRFNLSIAAKWARTGLVAVPLRFVSSTETCDCLRTFQAQKDEEWVGHWQNWTYPARHEWLAVLLWVDRCAGTANR